MQNKTNNPSERIAKIGILTSIALIIFVIECQIPPLAAIPGIKLGLANVVTLYALVKMSPKDAFLILVLRILLGSFFSGQIITLLYSLSGGVVCFFVEALLLKVLPIKNLWAVSVAGAIVHNIVQLCVAFIITNTAELFFYLPYLVLSGMITGAFTGVCVMLFKDRINF